MLELGVLFGKLNDAVNKEDFDAVVSVSDLILAQSPADVDALTCKCVALTKNNDYSNALKAIEAAPKEAAAALCHSRIYCLYRLRRFDEALKAFGALPAAERAQTGYLHLQAQILYQSGQAAQAVEIYERYFVKSPELDSELKCNICAAFVAAGQPHKVAAFLQQCGHNAADENYELAYNTACALADLGDLDGARARLQQATATGEQVLRAEGLSDAEIDDELAVLRAQLGYIAQLQGHADAALAAYTEVLAKKPSDSAVAAVANNNLVSLRSGDEKLFDSLKKQEKAVHSDESKLSVRQRAVIHLNRCLLLLFVKGDKCQQELVSLQKEMPDSESPPLVQAALAFRDKNHTQARTILTEFVGRKRTTSPSPALLLSLAHVHLTLNDATAAVDVLTPLARGEIAQPTALHTALIYRPALVASLVALYARLNQVDAAVQLLQAAVSHWQAQGATNTYRTLLRELARFQLSHGRQADGVSSLDRLVKGGSKGGVEPALLCQLVLAGAEHDVALAQKYAAQLPPMDGVDSIDVAALEAAAAVSSAAVSSSASSAFDKKAEKKRAKEAAAAAGDVPVVKKKSTRKKRVIMPKNWDATKPNGGLPPIDPERWLPRFERSYYKKSKKGKKNDVGKGSQGGISKAEKKEEEKPAAAAPVASPPSKKKGKK